MIKLENVHKSFGDLKVLKGVNLQVTKGEIISVIGSSGSGKSTLLRILNCLETADRGSLSIENKTYDLKHIKEKEKRLVRKQASMVFQNYNLFKHMTALENVIEGLLIDGRDKKEALTIGRDLLERVGLKDKLHAYPSQLSGGQQQRVGIARAMALKPEVILFDEPTSALDPELVSEVLTVIKRLAEEDITMIIVTHEMSFARDISDRIIYMNDGVIEVEDKADQFFESDNEKLRTFLGYVS